MNEERYRSLKAVASNVVNSAKIYPQDGDIIVLLDYKQFLELEHAVRPSYKPERGHTASPPIVLAHSGAGR